MTKKKNSIERLEDILPVRLYLNRIGASGRSLRTAVIEQKKGSGYWQDIAKIKFTKEGEIECEDARFAPTEQEREKIKAAFEGLVWPELKPLLKLPKNVPEDFKRASPADLFEFRDIQGRIIMVQLRKKSPDDRGKAYYAWTYWDDDVWRCQEPDGKLPIWGMEHLKDASTVFIHEGAKAARAMHELIATDTFEAKERLAKHPWGNSLTGAAHLGWVGGALSPQRTDWAQLQRLGVTRAYIVADNDEDGTRAVSKIAKRLKFPTFHLQFTSEWKASFDLADPWPEAMFATTMEKDKKTGEEKPVEHFIGPSFRSCLHPATWATDAFLVKNPQGKPTKVVQMREAFASQWLYCEEADVFVHTEFPQIIRDRTIFNNMMLPFSDTKDTAYLLLKQYAGRRAKLCYRPDLKGRIVTNRGTSAINLHIPSEIDPIAGDPSPFLDFMEYMIPDEAQRHEVLKWCATLIARPSVRMEYALLMVGEQGIGKSTLGAAILAPLVGTHNHSCPSESDITDSNFNEWLTNKRLAVIHEIYHGHSWKAYNRLKSVITETLVQINPKFERKYMIDCFIHVYACSNHEQAIRMDKGDRRWYYPTLADGPWPKGKYEELNNWLRAGGLGIIRHWAETFGEYVRPGDHAPTTERKKELIEESRSPVELEIEAFASRLAFEDDGETPKATARATTQSQVSAWVRRTLAIGKVFDSRQAIGKALVAGGLWSLGDKLKIDGRMETVYMNAALKAKIEAAETLSERNTLIRRTVLEQGDVQ